MLIDGNRRNVIQRYPRQPAPETRCEQLLNRLCELREDPYFTEWCRLTSALGLDDLPLDQLVALHAGAAETVFPEIDEWGQIAGNALAGPGAGDGVADAVLPNEAMTGPHLSGHADGLTAPELGAFMPPIGRGDHAMGLRPADVLRDAEGVG